MLNKDYKEIKMGARIDLLNSLPFFKPTANFNANNAEDSFFEDTGTHFGSSKSAISKNNGYFNNFIF